MPPGAILEDGAFAVVTTELECIWKRRKDLTRMSGQSVELGAHGGVQECGHVARRSRPRPNNLATVELLLAERSELPTLRSLDRRHWQPDGAGLVTRLF